MLLARVLIATRATQQHIRLIDNLDPGHVDNISDIPRLSTDEKAGVRGVVAENGRILITVHLCPSYEYVQLYQMKIHYQIRIFFHCISSCVIFTII